MTSPLEKLDSEIKSAMLARNSLRLNTIRMLKSALKYYQIEKKLDSVSENDLITVAKKQLKQRQDSIESYRAAGRQELLEKEEAELAILKEYLPQELSSGELEKIVSNAIAEVGATSRAQVGLVMKNAMSKAAGRADGKAINAIALKLLPA